MTTLSTEIFFFSKIKFLILFFLINFNFSTIVSAAFCYTDCYSKKGCFFKPYGCTPYVNCTYAFSYQSDGEWAYLELLGQGNSERNNYVAAAFSRDQLMGDDSVVECSSFNNGPLLGRASYNDGKTNIRLNLEESRSNSFIRTLAIDFYNGMIYCQIARRIQTPNGVNPARVFPLNNQYYILMSASTTTTDRNGNGGVLQVHNLNPASPSYPMVSMNTIAVTQYRVPVGAVMPSDNLQYDTSGRYPGVLAPNPSNQNPYMGQTAPYGTPTAGYSNQGGITVYPYPQGQFGVSGPNQFGPTTLAPPPGSSPSYGQNPSNQQPLYNQNPNQQLPYGQSTTPPGFQQTSSSSGYFQGSNQPYPGQSTPLYDQSSQNFGTTTVIPPYGLNQGQSGNYGTQTPIPGQYGGQQQTIYGPGNVPPNESGQYQGTTPFSNQGASTPGYTQGFQSTTPFPQGVSQGYNQNQGVPPSSAQFQDQGSSQTYPQQQGQGFQSTTPFPQGVSQGYNQNQGVPPSSTPYPNQGSSQMYPQQQGQGFQSTTPFPNQGSSQMYPQQGVSPASTPYSGQGSTQFSPNQGSPYSTGSSTPSSQGTQMYPQNQQNQNNPALVPAPYGGSQQSTTPQGSNPNFNESPQTNQNFNNQQGPNNPLRDQFSSQGIVPGSDNPIEPQLLKVHAILMTLAWMIFVSTAVLFARFYRGFWPNTTLCGLFLWFHFHRTLNLIGIGAMIAGFVCIFVARDWHWMGPKANNTKEQNQAWPSIHSILGLLACLVAWAQPLNAVFRCHPKSSLRPIYNIFHAFFGYGSYLMGTAALMIACTHFNFMFINRDAAFGLCIAFLATTGAVFILLEIMGIIHWFKNRNSTGDIEVIQPDGRTHVTLSDQTRKMNICRMIIFFFYIIIAIGCAIAISILIGLRKNEDIRQNEAFYLVRPQ